LSIPPRGSSASAPFIAILAASSSLEPPASIDDFSSHRLLWEFIADELSSNPFAINGGDVDTYLTSRARKLNVDARSLNTASFTSKLIAPAYRVGLVRLLRAANIPIREFDSLEDAALTAAVALLHVWPDQRRVHAIDFAARPAIRPGLGAAELIRRCRAALADPQAPASSSSNLISAAMVRELICAN
jgi:hypothetical protein